MIITHHRGHARLEQTNPRRDVDTYRISIGHNPVTATGPAAGVLWGVLTITVGAVDVPADDDVLAGDQAVVRRCHVLFEHLDAIAA